MGVDVSEMEGIDVGSFVVLKMKEGPSLEGFVFIIDPENESILLLSLDPKEKKEEKEQEEVGREEVEEELIEGGTKRKKSGEVESRANKRRRKCSVFWVYSHGISSITKKEKKCPIDLSSNDLLDIFTPTTATQQTTQNKQGQPQESSSEQQDERKQKIVTVLSQSRIPWSEGKEGEIIALDCLYIWPPYREDNFECEYETVIKRVQRTLNSFGAFS